MAGIPGPDEKKLQAYLIPNKTEMASMFGYQHSKHTWSLLLLTWQAYLVPFVIEMASILGPPYIYMY